MYVIILEKILAYLLCAGVMRAISIKWPFEFSKHRVYVYSVDTNKTLDSFPLEWQMFANNGQLFGSIPHFVDMVSSAIIGWFDSFGIESEIPQLWNVGENLCGVYNARLLEKPFYCNVKKEGFHEYLPDDLVSYACLEQFPVDAISSLYIPLGKRFFDQTSRGTILSIDLLGEAAKTLLTKDHELKEYSNITVFNGSKCRRFEFSKENHLQPSLDGTGKLKLFPSILKGGEMVARTKAIIYLENELNT